MHWVAPQLPTTAGAGPSRSQAPGTPAGSPRWPSGQPTAGAPDAHPPGTSVLSTRRSRSRQRAGSQLRCARSVRSCNTGRQRRCVTDVYTQTRKRHLRATRKQIRAGVGQAQGSIHSAGCAKERNVGVGEGTRAAPSVPSPRCALLPRPLTPDREARNRSCFCRPDAWKGQKRKVKVLRQ